MIFILNDSNELGKSATRFSKIEMYLQTCAGHVDDHRSSDSRDTIGDKHSDSWSNLIGNMDDLPHALHE